MPEVDEDATAELAELLSVDVVTLAEQLGGPWFELPRDEDGGLPFVTGVPAQVVLRLHPQYVTVAEPELVWRGAAPEFVLGKKHLHQRWDDRPTLEALGEAAREAATARRRSFRWCRFCRELHDPANIKDEVCSSCAEQFQGVVH